MQTLGAAPWGLYIPLADRDAAGPNFQVLFFPTKQQLHLQSPQRDFPMNVKTIHADYITTETHPGSKADCHFRNTDLVSPRTWPGVYPT